MRDSNIVFSICYQIGIKQLNQCPISEDWYHGGLDVKRTEDTTKPYHKI